MLEIKRGSRAVSLKAIIRASPVCKQTAQYTGYECVYSQVPTMVCQYFCGQSCSKVASLRLLPELAGQVHAKWASWLIDRLDHYKNHDDCQEQAAYRECQPHRQHTSGEEPVGG